MPVPLVGELFTAEQLDQHARLLAVEQRVGPVDRAMDPLRALVRRSEQILRRVRATLAQEGQQSRILTPSAAWLLDNAFLVGEQIREVRQDLPVGYYRELPKLASGPFQGYPRIFAIAVELIAHTDARIDAEQLVRFILAYESVTPLAMGELWATAIMLRIGLLVNLGRLSEAILEAHRSRTEADAWADRLLASDSAAPNVWLSDLRARYPHLPAPFVVRLLWRLQSETPRPDLAAVVEQIDRRVVDEYGGVEPAYHLEHQAQAANQASVSNTITSMRTLSTIDWDSWFERVSWTERTLREDPGGAYPRSTFATRDRDRHVVERLARRTGLDEAEVARRAVSLAGQVPVEAGARQGHVGYYLEGEGLRLFERQLGYRESPGERIRRALVDHPTPAYLGALGAATGALVAAGVAASGRRLRSGPGVLAAALLALPASEVAEEVVHWGLSQVLPPRTLPRLDLESGIPADLRTIVVVPILLLTPASIRGQLERLEVLSLAHADPHLHVALLSDFADAPAATMPEDAQLLAVVTRGIEELNARHGVDRFFLFHRRRLWNPSQARWMGWERKRGKLVEFNRLLAGARDTSFVVRVGEQSVLGEIRYVITLDADTQLPRDAARALIGTIAHPLNRPVIDPLNHRVVSGYGILQPRVNATLPSANRSRFARLFAGSAGLDPYAVAVSNVPMDLFGEGIYAGKGIYDPRVLDEVLGDRFPENALLSHDLVEGNYARVGFVSDVELLDSFPTTYDAYLKRHHRWIRGDWQAAPWLLHRVPTPRGDAANPLPTIARFKILDNLRRSLVAPASATALGAAVALPGGRPAAGAAEALLPLATPLLLGLLDRVVALARSPSKQAVLQSTAGELRFVAARFLIDAALLPDQAATNLDAIVRTLYRLRISHRDLLEWETAEQAERRPRASSRRVAERQFPGAALLAVLGFVGGRSDPQPPHLPSTRGGARVAGLLATAWLYAPILVRWLDRPPGQPEGIERAEDRAFLRRLARGYWHYFETFVTAEGNYFAPDNFQEDPRPVVAFRTSPTNIGLQLLADLAARDFGYLGILDLTERTERVFATLERLERYRGHFLNWYDTKSLQPLPPAYVSTVDSGNLAGHLLTLAQGFRELLDRPIVGPSVLDGLADALALTTSTAGGDQWRDGAGDLARLVARTPTSLDGLRVVLGEAAHAAEGFVGSEAGPPPVARQARSLRRDLDELLPGAAGFGHLDLRAAPTLRQLADGRTDAPVPADLRQRVAGLIARHDALRATIGRLVAEMDFRFLYDDQRRLFTIGYSVANGRRDNSYYDLLASEARLTSYLAIAKGDVPTEHWFHLGRSLTPADSSVALVSWGGTMFEYLMPLLVMRSFPETLLGVTYPAVVADQVDYGKRHHVPWGVSESAYDVRDASGNYQYRSFGIPGLGLRSGLANDLVIAPYATALALPIRPAAAVDNLRALLRDGMGGRYGLYEAVDYTRDRLPPGVNRAIIRSYMVHHQAMSLLAIDNALHDEAMLRRFHADPLARSAELLLQERFPRDVPAVPLPSEVESRTGYVPRGIPTREFATPNTPVPAIQILSNGTYTVLVTNAGAGFSTCGDLAVTRWREDPTRDCWGTFCYIRDARSGAVWSAGYQPTRHAGRDYRAVFSLEKAEFSQWVAGIETRLEIAVSAEDNVEVRRVSLTNRSAAPRELELTSYAEIVLAPPAADASHPAFSNLFVETEFIPGRDALLATRRPRSPSDRRDWAFHAVEVHGHAVGPLQYETDRAAFLGRGRTTVDPVALHVDLSQSVGAVLDPIFSLRRRVRIVPGGTAQVTFATGVAPTRDEALDLADKYRAPGAAGRVLEMAYAHVQAELHDLGLDGDEAHLIQRLTRSAIYADARLRAAPEILRANTLGQSALWGHGISGDHPIVLVRIADASDLGLVQQLIQAHQYWRLKHLTIDLVILIEQSTGYRQGLQDAVLTMVRTGRSGAWLNRPGGIFVLSADTMSREDRILLQTVARVDLAGWKGSLAEQLPRIGPTGVETAAETPAIRPPPVAPGSLASVDLREPTVFGGFSPDGREYVVNLRPDLPTTAPWINVVANEAFGFIVSESGGGYTWAINSQQNRLTPWSNDPVVDPIGEAIYLRDEDNGAAWSPLPHPRGVGPFRVRHGFGYSTFENDAAEIHAEVTLFVPRADPIKVYRVRLTNQSARPRRLTATFYVDWVLGTLRGGTAPFVVTDRDAARGAIFARNAYNADFAARVAFAAAGAPVTSATGDRTAFIGRNRDLRDPRGLESPALDEEFGAGLDPCGALRCAVALGPGEAGDLFFLLGQGSSRAESEALVDRYRDPTAANAAFDEVTGWWRDLLSRVQVSTPDPGLDLLLNGWLLYQTLACRVWGRSAFYQSGGAFGFRDQLQDVMATVQAAPAETRAQILRSAGRQFVEGDVQHWWHPPTGRGVRTRCSDDYLWLPFVTSHYVRATGDRAILDETVPFLTGRPLAADETEYYDLPAAAPESAPLYDHCARAIEHALGRFGPHGLPLIGSGDWNDGMNLVGVQGRGESIWVGWFLYQNLIQMADLAAARDDHDRAERYRAEAGRLQKALEEHGWDGAWYRRAYFDDGTPLGSARDEECRIDSIAQSWAVISGGGEPGRARAALGAAEERLLDPAPGLIKLLTPPFDHSALEPGYIKGYVPGVRENGGQYTHAALWFVWARSMLGEGERVAELFALLSPIRHAAAGIGKYKVEPYVVVADVYAAASHLGRGGWTWYTGSAGWMYRLGLEQLLGVRRDRQTLLVSPCIPPAWKGYEFSYRHGQATYHIRVENPGAVSGGVRTTEVDGKAGPPGRIPLHDDGREHVVRVVLGDPPYP